jgi:hypothetical protein
MQPSDVSIHASSYTGDSKRETQCETEAQAGKPKPRRMTNHRKDSIAMINNVYLLEQYMREEVTRRAAGVKRRDLSRKPAIRITPVVATRILLRLGRLVITWA